MPRNGSGTFTLAEAPFVFDTVISETAVNSDLSDIATGLTFSLAKDGQTTPTANLPMGNYKHTGVLASSGLSSLTEYASTSTFQGGIPLDAGDTGGTSTVYTATLTPSPGAYADKQCFRVKFNATCGATPTINFNSLGAKKLYKNIAGSAVQLSAGDVLAGQIWALRYDASLDSSSGGFLVIGFNASFTGGTLTSTLAMSGAAINEAKGSDIASATTTDIGAATGNFVDVTGTTTITGLGTVQAGTRRIVRFTGALTLTHNGTSLILPGAANITTAAGDIATFESLGSGNWVCCTYQKASGLTPFTKYYDSGGIGVTSGGTGTISHGLGGIPKIVTVWLRCLSSASGYTTGQEVLINPMVNTASSNTNQGVSIIGTATDFVIKFGSATSVFLIIDASSGATASQTNSNWEMVIRAAR